jgi:N-acyl-D-aspartate/D-glutamate deacylase
VYDVIISGGQVVDGTGAPGRRADVAIKDGKVADIGRVREAAERTVDADGLVVAPGFIDVHTHLDVQGFWDPTLSPSPLHGITTVLGGNCGFTVAPLNDDAAGYLMRMLARVEGMPLESLEAGVPWDWRTTAEFLDRHEGRLAVNAAFMVGHSALRRVVMGEAATERTATREEIDAMAALLRDGLAAGGLGFSSTWAETHNDSEGRPVPSRHATADEIVELAGVCREFEGTALEFLPVGAGPFSDEATELMIRMTVAARRPLNWNIISVTAKNLPGWLAKLAVSDRARERGGKIVGLTIPNSPAARFTFRSGFVLDALPGWLAPMALPPAQKLAMLRDPDQRKRLNELADRPGPMRHMTKWAQMLILETFTADTKRYEGRTVGDIAAEEGKEPFDALLDIVCTDELRTSFCRTPYQPTRADWEARAQVWRDPRAVVGASDAGAHLDMIDTFNYATVLLQHGVREQGLLSVEEGVRLLTDVPARLYGLRGRGRLAPGACADVVAFDLDRVGTGPTVTRVDLPGGAGRLYAEATGVEHVLVNGTEIATAGRFGEARPGRILRSGRDTATAPLT